MLCLSLCLSMAYVSKCIYTGRVGGRGEGGGGRGEGRGGEGQDGGWRGSIPSTHTHIHIHIYTYTHTHIHIYTYTHTHIHKGEEGNMPRSPDAWKRENLHGKTLSWLLHARQAG